MKAFIFSPARKCSYVLAVFAFCADIVVTLCAYQYDVGLMPRRVGMFPSGISSRHYKMFKAVQGALECLEGLGSRV